MGQPAQERPTPSVRRDMLKAACQINRATTLLHTHRHSCALSRSGDRVQRDSPSLYHLDDDRLGYGHHYYVVQIEIGILRLRLGPRREWGDHVVAEQRHEVIAFGKDHEARRRSDPADDVRHGVGVTGKRSNAWL